MIKAIYFRWASVGIICFSLVVLVVSSVSAAPEEDTNVSANCDIQAGACVQALGEGSVSLEILPRPVTAMTDLTFRVTLERLSTDGDPGIDLGMPGMSMGPNHVSLEKTPEGGYTGSGVIVRCPSGKSLWQADVSIPGAGTAAFLFDVVY